MLHFNLRLFTMMNIRVKLLVAIILYQFFLFVHAQGLIDVRHYSIEDGLSQNIVQDMLQDDDGYIWLATWNGLEKYDGYTFKNYKSYPTDAIKLKYNRMVQVIKGSDHTLWCHTYDDKVYLFDTQRERFEDVFVYHPQIEECDLVEKLIPLNNGIVWVVASDGNLWRIDEADYQKDNGVIFLSSGSVPQHGNHVYSVVLDAYNNEWILTDKGCFVYGKRELSDKRDFKYAVSLNHQFYMATSSGEIVLYTSKGGIKEVNFERIDWDIMGLLALKDGKMGVITKRGVIVVDTYNNHAENILIDKSSSDISPSGFFQSTDNKLWMFNGKSNVVCCDLKHNKIEFVSYPFSQREKMYNFIHEDSYGRIWILASNGEFSFYNPTKNLFEQGYTYINGEKVSYKATGRKFLVDNQKNIWLSCDSGVDMITFLNENYSYFSMNHHDKIRGLFVDSRQRVWIADKSKRIEVYDREHRYIGNLNEAGDLVQDRQVIFGADIYCFFEDEAHRLWMGSRENGIYVAAPEAEKFRIFHFKHDKKDKRSLSSDAIYAFGKDVNGHIWIGTYGGGLNVVDGIFPDLHFIHSDNGLDLYPKDECRKVRSIYCTSTGIMLVGTTDGLLSFSAKTDEYRKIQFNLNHCETKRANSLSNNDVIYTFESKKGEIYIITHSSGLNLVTSKNLLCDNIEFVHLNKQNGLPSDMAYTMIEGNRNELWISFEDQICRYNPDRGSIESYNRFYFHSVLEVKSTNGDGLWVDNMARLFIHVKPTFWETGWAWLLYVILILLIIVAVSVTLAYIFNLRRKVDFEQQITNLKLRFFTDISHELRTSLTLIASPIEEVIDHEKLSEEGRENMLIAKKNTDRMLRLINQLLDFRKIQNNKMKLYIEETDIVSLSKKIFETFTALAHQRNINFQFICSCDSYVLYTDIDKFEKIVFNLLSNAFKYTPDGKNIDFILEPQNDVFFFKVRDEGNGIELQKIDMLFKRFETLGYTDPNFSSGIGLSLVKELVDMLHGSIMVDSKLGQGSVFSVSLSRSYEVFQSDKNVEFILNDSKTMPSIETQVEQKEEFIKDITVLVVDDNEELRYFIVSILRKEYHIIEAENGKKGLEIIRLELPDLVLSDVMMPCMDGIELLEEVKKNHDTSHIPFVLLSAKSALDDRIRGLEYGADDYITKPFSSGYLRARISSLLKQREMLHDYFMKQAFRSFEQENLVASSVSLDSFSPSIPQITSFDEVFIQRVIQVVESKLQEQDFKIEDLADTMKMGRTVFYRKVKSILGVTPIDLVKDMRVKRAIQLLDSGNYNISQVAYMSGFSSPQYFSRVFKELKNCTPSEYKTKAFD